MTQSHTTIQTIDVHELKKRRDTDPTLCLIDVREQHEWDEQHIPGAHHIPKDSLTEQIANVTTELNCPIYLHCKGGTRSQYAANCLLAMGYCNVYSINGGIMEWAKAGYPTT